MAVICSFQVMPKPFGDCILQHCPSMNGISKNASHHGIPVTHDPSRAMVHHHVILNKHISTVELKIVTPWLCLLLLNSEGCNMLTDLPAAVKMA